MIVNDKTIIRALRLWNSWQSPWTKVKTYRELSDVERAKVLDIARDLEIMAEQDGLTKENYVQSI
jgi:hypothetical protein